MKGSVLRIATGGAVVAALMTVVALPASAAVTPALAPVVNIANPAPGDYLRRGQNWVAGVACDPNAALTDPSAGIAKVSIYLGDRDTTEGTPSWRPGGYMGVTTSASVVADFSANAAQYSRMGLSNPDQSTCKNPTAGFRVLPSSFRKGTWTMNIYVQAKNGKETRVTIPGLRVDKP
ncbi:MAG TPA: hypothetical protein VGQ62_09745 [Chloroflexota bacterium]|jgi:hypothetical protein|nr:hypothetical protein [Chloroflexota bacterium]